MFDISGKHVLVTGASSGIGLALVTHLKDSGCMVSGIDIHISDALESLDITALIADVSQPESLLTAFEEAMNIHGPLDGLINNAGVALDEGPLSEAEIKHLERAFDINVKGVYLGMKYAARFLKEGGSIINTASLAATITLPEYCAYSMSKAAVIQMTKNAALQFGNKSIRVNSVSPGTILTPMEAEDGVEARLSALTTALSRPGQTNDLTGVYHFLLSDAAKYITGIDLRVDGGWSAGHTNQELGQLLNN